MMNYLNEQVLSNFDVGLFRQTSPYPWTSINEFIRPDKYAALISSLPPQHLFEERFGHKRKFGQMSHDRLTLDYAQDLELSDEWHEFVQELMSPQYLQFIHRIAGTKNIQLEFHWHYTPRGCSVSPHCDSTNKIGSQIFYLNTEQDWDSSWGGDTLILDDEGRFSHRSNPTFSEFNKAYRSESIGNRSLLFIRNGNSWHGVKEITCPEGQLRKVFIVVIKKLPLTGAVRRLFSVK